MTARPARGLSYQELLDTDTRKVPGILRDVTQRDLGLRDVPVERYTSRAFHDLEVERLWKRVWQMACREEEIPEIGDHVVYDIASLSVLVIRTAPGVIRAYPNACLHRGRLLKDHDGSCRELRCPFHGFTWSLDGELISTPTEWDFPHVSPEKFRLPELRVGTWGGFVFVNMDPECESLERFLTGLDRQFERWPLDRRYKQAHVAKPIRANWKVAQEAFMEAFHVVATHPQLLPGIGDTNSQYDVYENFSRAITPNGTPSPEASGTPTEQDILDSVIGRGADGKSLVSLPPGASARAFLAAATRGSLAPIVGAEYAESLCDAELADSFYYTVFPNFHPWGAFNRIVYRFRPQGNDPDSSLMEVMFLAPYREGEKPPPAKVHWLGADDDWLEAPELGFLARIFNQDSGNLAKVQRGLHAMQKPGVTLARYQETKLRHFHLLLEKWLYA